MRFNASIASNEGEHKVRPYTVIAVP